MRVQDIVSAAKFCCGPFSHPLSYYQLQCNLCLQISQQREHVSR